MVGMDENEIFEMGENGIEGVCEVGVEMEGIENVDVVVGGGDVWEGVGDLLKGRRESVRGVRGEENDVFMGVDNGVIWREL